MGWASTERYCEVIEFMTYTKQDCINDTQEHINQVRLFMYEVISRLDDRATEHDKSKMEEPELSIFTEYTPKLKNTTFGSDEYKENLKGMQSGLEHHYQQNKHHPEHWKNGINDMSLLDIVEMLVDWKAATQRHDVGDMLQSLKINKERFGISDQLYKVLYNTVKELGW